MGMSRAEKNEEIVALNQRFNEEELVVVTQYSGLTVKELTDLRNELRKNGAKFKVIKNRLAQRALKGTKFEKLEDMFAGPTGIATSKDPVAAAKVTFEFAKKNQKLIIVGAGMGETVLDPKGVEALAKLPSLDEIRSRLVGLLVAAPTKLAGVLQAPARDLVGVTKAYGEKQV